MKLLHLNLILRPVFGNVFINSLIVYAFAQIHISLRSSISLSAVSFPTL